MTADEFNGRVPVGTPVRYYSVPGVAPRLTRTRSAAWTLGSGHVVVAVEGRSGGVSIKHLERVDAAAPHFDMLFDALREVELTEDELASLVWLATWEKHTCENIARIFRKCRGAA